MALCKAVGCNSQTKTHTPAPRPWDPCTSIPDHAFTAIGFDPATKTPPAHAPGVITCTMQAIGDRGSHLGITSTTATLGTFEQINSELGYTRLAVAGHDAIQYRPVDNDTQRECDITMATSWGTLTVAITIAKTGDVPCRHAARTATALALEIP